MIKIQNLSCPKYLQLGSVAFVVAAIAVLTFASIAWATWTSPIESSNIGDGHGVSHWSKVKYTISGDPGSHNIDKVWYGGRRPDFTLLFFQKWRRGDTIYYGYNDGWDIQHEVEEGEWLTTGSPGLDYYYLENDVETCCNFAIVKQRLRFSKYHPLLGETIEWYGYYHTHHLYD